MTAERLCDAVEGGCLTRDCVALAGVDGDGRCMLRLYEEGWWLPSRKCSPDESIDATLAALCDTLGSGVKKEDAHIAGLITFTSALGRGRSKTVVFFVEGASPSGDVKMSTIDEVEALALKPDKFMNDAAVYSSGDQLLADKFVFDLYKGKVDKSQQSVVVDLSLASMMEGASEEVVRLLHEAHNNESMVDEVICDEYLRACFPCASLNFFAFKRWWSHREAGPGAQKRGTADVKEDASQNNNESDKDAIIYKFWRGFNRPHPKQLSDKKDEEDTYVDENFFTTIGFHQFIMSCILVEPHFRYKELYGSASTYEAKMAFIFAYYQDSKYHFMEPNHLKDLAHDIDKDKAEVIEDNVFNTLHFPNVPVTRTQQPVTFDQWMRAVKQEKLTEVFTLCFATKTFYDHTRTKAVREKEAHDRDAAQSRGTGGNSRKNKAAKFSDCLGAPNDAECQRQKAKQGENGDGEDSGAASKNQRSGNYILDPFIVQVDATTDAASVKVKTLVDARQPTGLRSADFPSGDQPAQAAEDQPVGPFQQDTATRHFRHRRQALDDPVDLGIVPRTAKPQSERKSDQSRKSRSQTSQQQDSPHTQQSPRHSSARRSDERSNGDKNDTDEADDKRLAPRKHQPQKHVIHDENDPAYRVQQLMSKHLIPAKSNESGGMSVPAPLFSQFTRYYRWDDAKSFRWAVSDTYTEFCEALIDLCKEMKDLFEKEDRLLKLEGTTYVLGDVHGNYHDLKELEKKFWSLGAAYSPANILFLGDYVDRGVNSIEAVAYLFSMKKMQPTRFFLTRGNHDDERVNSWSSAGNSYVCLKRECEQKCGGRLAERVFAAINSVFTTLPLAAVVNDNIFCAHSGFPRIDCDVETALNVQKFPHEIANVRKCKVARAICYNDPNPDPQTSEDFVGHHMNRFNASRVQPIELFSKTALREFLDMNGFEFMIRANSTIRSGSILRDGFDCLSVYLSNVFIDSGDHACFCLCVPEQTIKTFHLHTGAALQDHETEDDRERQRARAAGEPDLARNYPKPSIEKRFIDNQKRNYLPAGNSTDK